MKVDKIRIEGVKCAVLSLLESVKIRLTQYEFDEVMHFINVSEYRLAVEFMEDYMYERYGEISKKETLMNATIQV